MGTEGAENLIGRDLKKPDQLMLDAECGIEPMSAAGFEEVEGSVDVGGDEVSGAGDATINVRLGGEVHDVGDVMLADDAKDFCFVAKVNLLEDIAWVNAMDAIEIFEMTGIGEAIEIDELRDPRLVNDLPNEI